MNPSMRGHWSVGGRNQGSVQVIHRDSGMLSLSGNFCWLETGSQATSAGSEPYLAKGDLEQLLLSRNFNIWESSDGKAHCFVLQF